MSAGKERGLRKVSGYVAAYRKHERLAAKYQDKLDALLPLKRKRDAAEVALKIKQQKMTGGELSRALRILNGGLPNGTQIPRRSRTVIIQIGAAQ